jgi:hypothetical protein
MTPSELHKAKKSLNQIRMQFNKPVRSETPEVSSRQRQKDRLNRIILPVSMVKSNRGNTIPFGIEFK